MTPTVLRAERALLPTGWQDDVALEEQDGRWIGVGPGAGVRSDRRVGALVLPGFVDTHVHGGGGASLASTDPDEIRTVIATHATGGSTTVLASLVTAEIGVLQAQLRTLAPMVRSGELAGVHLEGPFLSGERRGAHDPELLVDPTPERLDALVEAAGGTLSMVTLAPELPGGLAAVRRLAGSGISVAIGHTTADAALTGAAIEAGVRVATHLFNAMAPIHHRAPGPVPRLLTDQRVLVELIADGIHLAEDVLAMAVAAAGPDRVALVTDAMAAAGRPDGHYDLGAMSVLVRDRVARLVGTGGETGSIAGSTLTMAEAVARVAALPGVGLAAAATMAARTPARWHRITGAGEIAVGAKADLVQVDEAASLLAVLRAGRPVTG